MVVDYICRSKGVHANISLFCINCILLKKKTLHLHSIVSLRSLARVVELLNCSVNKSIDFGYILEVQLLHEDLLACVVTKSHGCTLGGAIV